MQSPHFMVFLPVFVVHKELTGSDTKTAFANHYRTARTQSCV